MKCVRWGLCGGLGLWAALLLMLALGACSTAYAPQTPRENYAAAEVAYQTAAKTVICMTLPKDAVVEPECLGLNGLVARGTPMAGNVGTALTAARAALDVWGTLPDSEDRMSLALPALRALQGLIISIKQGGV